MVAARAGVSPTTVSAALRGRGKMSHGVRKKIRNLAQEMGYQVDPILSAAMTQMRTRPERRFESVLAWLDATPRRDTVDDSVALRVVLQGASTQAAEMGYLMERFWLDEPGMAPERLARIFRARGIEGIVILQYYRDSSAIPRLEFDVTGFGCVSVTTRLNGPDIHFAQADHFACAELAMQELAALGYRRIGLVCPPSVDSLTQRRIYAAYEGFVRHHPEMRRIAIFTDESNNEKAALAKWIRAQKPEVVLGWKPPEEFRQMGLSVPDELGVCMLDYLPEFGDCAGVYQNHSEIGAAAVRLLHAQLQQGLRGLPKIPMATMVEGRWTPGNSLRSLRDVNRKARSMVKRRP